MATPSKFFNSTNPYINFWSQKDLKPPFSNDEKLFTPKSEPSELLAISLEKISLGCLTTRSTIGAACQNLEKLQATFPSNTDIAKLSLELIHKIKATEIDLLSLYQLNELMHTTTDETLKVYLNRRITLRISEIERSEQMQGFYFKITNSKGISSYLIGISHRSLFSARFPKKTQTILDSCSEIITEVGNNKQTFETNELEERTSTDPLRFRMDHQVVRYAVENKIPLTALEDQKACEKLFKSLEKLSAKQKSKRSLESKDFISKHKDLESFEVLEAVQKGNYEELARYSRCVYSIEECNLVVTNRNHNWLFDNALTASVNRVGLVKRLKETKEPLAIVVGAGHLPNEDGLVSILGQQGFIVERDLS